MDNRAKCGIRSTSLGKKPVTRVRIIYCVVQFCARILHRNAYAPIQAPVTRQPFLHMTISSIRSCSQNTEPDLETKRRKLTAVMGMESWSRVESSLLAVFLGDDGAGPDETDNADVKTAWVRFMEVLEVRFNEDGCPAAVSWAGARAATIVLCSVSCRGVAYGGISSHDSSATIRGDRVLVGGRQRGKHCKFSLWLLLLLLLYYYYYYPCLSATRKPRRLTVPSLEIAPLL